MKLLKQFSQKNIGAGYLYFYIHLITEILCFYSLTRLTENAIILWIAPLFYDCFAFVPQAIIGYIHDKYPKINFCIIGIIILLIGFIIYNLNIINLFISLFLICIGNCFIHVAGAEVTLRASNGKLSHAAIFVSGGSFGVIIGRLLGTTSLSYIFLIILGLTMIPFALLADSYKDKNSKACSKFNYSNPKLNPKLIIFLATFVVVVRGYMGYGIPTAWNKTTLETIFLYCTMGIGKALGGVLSDSYGLRKMSIISILAAVPFLLFGDNIMTISLIGIMLFSMTMSITLGLLVSVLKNKPGLAFGYTTIGLFLGTVPIFFIKFTSLLINNLVIIFISIICLIIMLIITRKEIKE